MFGVEMVMVSCKTMPFSLGIILVILVTDVFSDGCASVWTVSPDTEITSA